MPLTSIDEAREIVLAHVHGRLGKETVGLAEAPGRVLAAELRAGIDLPPFRSSAMDGYALTGMDARTHELVGEARAGAPYERPLHPGQAVRISTGALVPEAAVAVTRQEDAREHDGRVELSTAVSGGENIREAGEDIRAGELVLDVGTRIRAQELAAAAAAGAGRLEVASRPRVAILSTGDELREPGAALSRGQLHDSNSPMLATLVEASGAEVVSRERLPDDRPATEQGLKRALSASDVVILTGGVSVGPHDHVKPALHALGVQEHFWRVALKPGKPTWFGTLGSTLVFGLPGNPASAAVTFSLFVRPALERLLGARAERHVPAEARLAEGVTLIAERAQAIRVRVDTREGVAYATPAGAQGSHRFRSLLDGDRLAIIPAGEGALEEGSIVRLQPMPS